MNTEADLNTSGPDNATPASQEQSAKYFLAAIVESSQDSIVTIDLDRIVTSWNRSAERLYGFSAEEAIGAPLANVMLEKDIVDLIEKVKKIQHEISVPIYETVRMHKNGKMADLQIALSPVRNARGEVIGISTIARDITEAKLQEQLKDEFIAIASHELKTPVTSIKAYSELLIERMQELADEQSFTMIEKLGVQIDRLTDLIKTLLDTTKLSAGEVLLKKARFDLCELIEEQVETLQRLSPKHQLSFTCERGHFVHADRKLLAQVITNLVTNAIKYSVSGGKVLLAATTSERESSVTVQDFGVGIPEAVSDKIFERYFRVNSKQKSTVPGIGLGLYITAKIVHQHGGQIHVDSTEGVGSTFSFTIPSKAD